MRDQRGDPSVHLVGEQGRHGGADDSASREQSSELVAAERLTESAE